MKSLDWSNSPYFTTLSLRTEADTSTLGYGYLTQSKITLLVRNFNCFKLVVNEIEQREVELADQGESQ